MGHHEVLAARLSHDPRIGLISVDLTADLFPEPLENRGGAGVVDAGKVGMRKYDLTGDRAGNEDQIHHTIRQSGCFEDLHDDLSAVDLCVGWFPHGHISHQNG